MSLKSATATVSSTAERVTRPARYAVGGLKGTADGLLNGMSRFGQKGLWAGLGVGIFVGIATGGLGYVMMFAAGGFITGALGGAAFGALKGGYDGVTLAARRDKYSDEVAERQTARAARESRSQNSAPTRTYRDVQAARQNVNNYNFERQLQQERENEADYSSHWRDRVSAGQSNGNGRGY